MGSSPGRGIRLNLPIVIVPLRRTDEGYWFIQPPATYLGDEKMLRIPGRGHSVLLLFHKVQNAFIAKWLNTVISHDYTDAFNPVPHASVLRILLVIATENDMFTDNVDISKAFTQGDFVLSGPDSSIILTSPTRAKFGPT